MSEPTNPTNPAELSNRELLIIMFDRSERLERAIFGNGQPGILTRMANIEGAQPSKTEKVSLRAGLVAALTALVLAIPAFIEKVLPV